MELTPGVVLVGRYRLDRKIGEGGMGAVWLGKNISVGTDVAIKTLKLDASANSEIVMRFRREAYLLACVRSDHVCRVLDFASDEKYGHVLVLDFIRGQPLSDLLSQRVLTVEEALEIGTDVARGMLDLHQANIVHRDLKPGNILLEPRPEGRFRALIVDFGLGRRMRPAEDMQSGITSMDVALGTLEYMAPEQILNSRGANPSADIYSLGAMLFRAVVGRHLFGDLQGGNLAHAKLGQEPPPVVTGRKDAIAQRFEAIVARAIQKNTANRYATTDEILNDLLAVHRLREEIGRSSMPSLPAAAAQASAPPAPAPLAPRPILPVAAPSPSPSPTHAPLAASTAPPAVQSAGGRRGYSGVAVFVAVTCALLAGGALGVVGERIRAAHALKQAPAEASAKP